MAETAAWLVDRVIPRVPVRQWVLSFPIPLRSLFAVHPELLAPVLQIIHRIIATHLIRQTGVKRSEATTGAVTLIRRFGSAANLNIHLHALVLDGVYCTMGEGVTVFHPAPALTSEKLPALLDKIIRCILRLLSRQGHLVEEEGMTYVADAHGIIDPENLLAPLQAASCTYRIAFGPRAGRKVLSWQYAARRAAPIPQPRCANAHGFSLHAGVCCAAEQRSDLEHLCRYIMRPAIANERLSVNRAGQVVLKLKTAYRDGTSHLVIVAAGIHATAGSPGATPAPASHPFSWGARASRQAAGRDRADSRADNSSARNRLCACPWRLSAYELGAVVEARVRHRYRTLPAVRR